MENDLSNSYVVFTQLDLTGITLGLQKMQTLLQQPIKVAPVSLAAPAAPIAASTKAVTGMNTALVGAGKSADGATQNVQKFNKATVGTKNALTDVARRVFVWGSMSAVIFGALISLKEFYDLTIGINTAMGELKKVMPKETDFEWMKAGALDLSVSFGQAPTDALKVMTLFAQAGLDAKESMDATRLAMLGINTTGADTDSMFNSLLGAARLFGIEFADAGTVIDKVMRIQADYAVSAKDLIQSIQAVGPAVTTLGGNIDDLFAGIATMGEAARISGKEAANVLKRVFSLMVSPEGINALQNVGVQIMATADSYRPLGSIMSDIINKWDSLTQTQQTNLALTLAQVRQYSKFIAMVQNADKYNEALTSSQNALGDAYAANIVALDTYAKKSEIASAKIAKLGATAIEGGGIAESFIQAKVGLGMFAEKIDSIDLGKFGGKVVSAVFSLGALTGAFMGLNALVRTKKDVLGFNNALASMNEKGAVSEKQLVGLKRQFGVVASVAQRAVLGVMGFVTVLAIASAAWAYFTEDTRKRRKIVQDSVDDFNRFKESLEDLPFSVKAGTTGTERFSSIRKVIEDVDKVTGTVKEKADRAIDAFSYLFYDVGKDNLTAIQLGELENRLKGVKLAVDTITLRPFNIEIDKVVKEMGGTLGNFVEQFSKNAVLKPIKFTGLTASGELVGEKRILTEYGKALKDIGDIGRSWWETNTTSIDTIFEVGEAVNAQITKIVELREEYAKLAKETGNFSDVQKRMLSTLSEADISININKGVEALLSLVDTEKLFTAAAEGSNLALAKIFEVDPTKLRQKAAADIAAGLIERIKADAKVWAKESGADFQQISTFIDSLSGSFKGLADSAAGLNVISVDTIAFLSGLKRSTAAIMSGFAAEASVLGEMYSAAGGMKEVFNVGEESIRAVDAAIQAVLQTFRQNESQIKTLGIEYKALMALKTEAGKGEVALQPGEMEKWDKQLKSISERQTGLINSQKISGEQLPKQLATLVSLKKQYQEILNIEKRRSVAIKAESDLSTSLLKQKTEINKIKYDRETEALTANRNIYRDILDAQLRYVDAQLRIGDIEASTVDIKKDELLYAYQQESIMREIEARVSKLSTLYGDLRNDAKGVGDAFADVLTNQRALLDDLTKKASAFQVFKRLAGSIASVFAEADARIISNYLSRKAEGLFPAAKSEIKSLEAELDAILKNSTLGTSTKLSIIDGGTLAAAKIKSAMIEAGIQASSDMAAVYLKMSQIAAEAIVAAQAGGAIGSAVGKFTMTSPPEFDKFIEEAAKFYGLSAELIKAVIYQESRFDPNAVSRAGAQGLMQLMPDTAKEMGVTDAFDPKQNIMGGAKYLKQQLDRFGDLELALAAYNVGPGNVDKYGGVPPFKETEDYIKKIMGSLDNSLETAGTTTATKIYTAIDTSGTKFCNNVSTTIGVAGIKFANQIADTLGVARINFEKAQLPESRRTNVEKFNIAPLDISTAFITSIDTGSTTAKLALEQGVVTGGITASSEMEKGIIKGGMVAAEMIISNLSVWQEEAKKFLEIEAATQGTDNILQKEPSLLSVWQKQATDKQAIDVQEKKAFQAAMLRQVGSMAGQAIGVAIAKGGGRDTSGVAAGSNIGTVAGGLIGNKIGAIGGPLGMVMGGILGSVLGGLFGDKEEQEKQTKELAQISNNTAKLVDKLSPEIINAPSTFTLPVGNGAGGVVTITNNFNISGGRVSSSDLQQIERQINDIYSRSTKRYTSLA